MRVSSDATPAIVVDEIMPSEITIELESPTGPRVRYPASIDVKDVEAKLPAGWSVDWSTAAASSTKRGALWSATLIRPVGRPARAGGAADERVTIRFTADELAELETAANGEPLSRWIGTLALKAARRKSQ